jgi:diacylglycerol kinase family enzyme
MFLHFKRVNPKRVEIFQARSAIIDTSKRMHFQVDGEYIGKISHVTADIIESRLHLILPAKEK